MNRFIFAIIFLCNIAVVNHASGSGYISYGIIQDGKELPADSLITSPEPFTLTLNEGIKPGDWTLEVLTENGFEKNGEGCENSLTCLIDPSVMNWRTASTSYDESHNWDYFTLRVTFSRNGNALSQRYYKLALLPSRPVLANFHFDYQYDWECDAIWPNGFLYFDIECENAIYCTLRYTEAYVFEHRNLFIFGYDIDITKEKSVVYDAEWGEFFQIFVGNNFGWVDGEIHYTTSFIDDEAVLARINELRELAGTESNFIEDDISIQFDGQSVSWNSACDHAAIYGISGNLIQESPNCETMDVSQLPAGIYIVRYSHNSKQYNHKIMKP